MFEKLFSKKKSSEIAKDRLKLVLIHDRRVISNTVLTEMRAELMTVISKYIRVDHDKIDIQFDVETENRNKGALILNVPVEEIIQK